MTRILALDGDTRTALAVVRSLGRAGFEVDVQASHAKPLAEASFFCNKVLESPPPTSDPIGFQEWLLDTVEHYDFCLPLTDCTLELTLQLENEIRELTKLPFVSYDTFLKVNNKSKLLALASAHDIPVPQTLTIAPAQRLDLSSFPFPAVIKGLSGRVKVSGVYQRPPVSYPDTADEAEKLLSSTYREFPVLLQERILGDGYGFFALCSDGGVQTSFAHHRVLEKPPSGGVSVLCESFPKEKLPQAASEALLKDLRWQGVAMLEYKQGVDGKFYLMEINPRFWGSLQLAIDCGVNFPELLFRDREKDSTMERAYPLGKRLRAEFGCLDHALIRIKQEGLGAFFQILFFNALQFFSAPTRLELFRWSDPKPFFRKLQSWLKGK